MDAPDDPVQPARDEPVAVLNRCIVEHAGAVSIREMDVLQLVAKGLSYEEIGGALQLRYNTIASYTKGIYRKLAVRSRGEAVFEATQLGLLK